MTTTWLLREPFVCDSPHWRSHIYFTNTQHLKLWPFTFNISTRRIGWAILPGKRESIMQTTIWLISHSRNVQKQCHTSTHKTTQNIGAFPPGFAPFPRLGKYPETPTGSRGPSRAPTKHKLMQKNKPRGCGTLCGMSKWVELQVARKHIDMAGAAGVGFVWKSGHWIPPRRPHSHT